MSGKTSIRLEVINNQRLAEGEEESLEYRGEGQLYRKNEKTYLVYEESGEGISGSRTTVKIAPENNRVLISRSGSGGLRQDFRAGQTHFDTYHTPGGKMQLKTETESLEIDMEEERGRVEIEYSLYISGEYFSHNSLSICFKTGREE